MAVKKTFDSQLYLVINVFLVMVNEILFLVNLETIHGPIEVTINRCQIAKIEKHM